MQLSKMDATYRAIALCLLVSISALVGCGSTEEPEDVVTYNHDYSEEFAIPVEVDTVLLTVGTSGYLPNNVDTTSVFIDTANSVDEFLRFDIEVVGRTYVRDERAVVDYRWRGDTLQVWCGYSRPWSWKSDFSPEKTSYPNPWFMAKRVNVTLPEGATVRYLGRWFE
jgi:hypothetical protein